MTIRFAPRARRDLEEIREYLEMRSPAGARNVLRAIKDAVRFVGEHPLASEQTDDPAIRVKIVLAYRYKIFYRVRGSVIEIVHVRHTSRRPWLGP
jgi:toxin ParE1/3/4